jgi:deoxyribodipyrimidine photo-lyase
VGYNQARLRRLNEVRIAPAGDYVLYWAQIYRRLERNHALDYALKCAEELGRPLVVYEGLRIDYPWASRRLHRFVLEGMEANAARAAELGLNYWPFVEREKGEGRGLLRRLSERAALVVTDDYPCFVVPPQAEALARRVEVPVFAVDSNSLVPLSLLGPAVSAAAHLRPRIHKALAEAWLHRAAAKPRLSGAATKRRKAPFETWKAKSVAAFVDALPLDPSVPVVAQTPGGTPAGRARLRGFVRKQLRGYAEARSEPRSPAEGHASGLSPYLHFGHLSVEEVAETVLATTGKWSPGELRLHNRGKREGFFCDNPDVNAFLDEALTWRDVGFQWHWSRRRDTASLETALPAWALATLGAHAGDPRPRIYSAEEMENGATHDPLWNAAQRDMAARGKMHGWLRMYWAKKILEWTRSPEEAIATALALNDRYELDGRDPNGCVGVLWSIGGLHDRPWGERPVFGQVRYMSFEGARRKFDAAAYVRAAGDVPTRPRTSDGDTGRRP